MNPIGKPTPRSLSFVLLIMLTTWLNGTASVYGEDVIKYKIEIVTGSNGTDNYVEMYLRNDRDQQIGDGGDDGGWYPRVAYVPGKTEEAFIDGPDIGLITKLKFDKEGIDSWACVAVRVYRDWRQDGTYDGKTEFVVNAIIDNPPTGWYTGTIKERPRVTLSPSGRVELNEEMITIVNFGINPHESESQTVMQYTESWSMVNGVTASETKSNQIGASVSVGYQPPGEIGGLTAEASVSFDRTVESMTETSQEKMKASEFDWSYTAPANSVVFRKIQFKVPYADQLYKFSDGSKDIKIRRVHAQIVPAGVEEFLFLPRKEDGKVVPVPWSEIENEWLVHVVRPEEITKHRGDWEAKKWVYSGDTPPPSETEERIQKAKKQFEEYRSHYKQLKNYIPKEHHASVLTVSGAVALFSLLFLLKGTGLKWKLVGLGGLIVGGALFAFEMLPVDAATVFEGRWSAHFAIDREQFEAKVRDIEASDSERKQAEEFLSAMLEDVSGEWAFNSDGSYEYDAAGDNRFSMFTSGRWEVISSEGNHGTIKFNDATDDGELEEFDFTISSHDVIDITNARAKEAMFFIELTRK